jgi:hypothetical protein
LELGNRSIERCDFNRHRGYQNVVGAAYPSVFVGSLNVDLVNEIIVRLAHIENADEIPQKIIENTGLIIRDID